MISLILIIFSTINHWDNPFRRDFDTGVMVGVLAVDMWALYLADKLIF